jgi:DNA-binding SARP family transcriptional activator
MNPARERVWGQLMVALYRSEMRAAALIAFTNARTALATRYGIEPGPVLQRLHRQVLMDDPALADATIGHLTHDLAASTSACLPPQDCA